MPNRFIARIRSGKIDSVDELKSEFKALAKASHPDLAGPDRAGSGASGEEFARIRQEYEDALRDFGKHRYGSNDAGGERSGEAWLCLALALKRGFPKVPRHHKERLRYEYALWRLERALAPELRDSYPDFAREMLGLRSSAPEALDRALSLLRDMIEFRERALSPMRTHIVISLSALRADPRIGPAFLAFARRLAAELGLGGEIADSLS